MITVLMLGSFVLEVDGTLISAKSWKSQKALALFKFLAHMPGKKVPRDRIIEILWSDSEMTSASHNFHTTLYNLRRSLFPQRSGHHAYPVIHHANGLYWFAPSKGYYVDLVDFKEKVCQCSELEHRDPNSALKVGLEAFKLYRGDFLEEDVYQEWTAVLRENIREMYLDLAVRTAELCVRCNQDYEQAIQVCRRALEFDPSREKLHQQIIRYLVATDRYNDAVIQYKSCEKAMQEDLEIAPSVETTSLINQVHLPKYHLWPRDKNTFAEMVNLSRRRSTRESQPCSLIIITLPKELGSLADRTINILQGVLRRDDFACRCAEHQVIILLPLTDQRGAEAASKRIETVLSKNISGCRLSLLVLEPIKGISS